MKWQAVNVACIVVCLSIASAVALPPKSQSAPTASLSPGLIDYNKYVNANKLLGFVSNLGHLFYDASKQFGRNDGLYYPYTSIADIQSGVNDKTVVFSAGLWMGGIVGPDTLITVAEYSTEYVPGNMIGGSYDPLYLDNKYRVYKLYRDSMASNPNADYLQWPVAQGAPLDSAGHPLLLGDQTAWCVYNDAEPADHTNNAGGTAPLGIEVRQTVWASSDSSESNVINVKYQLYNKGSKNIADFYVAFWADPDLGGASDDLVGCDTLQNTFFVYNATNADAKYGSAPPAWGGKLMVGPIVPSSGDSAIYFGNVLHGYRNLGMTAFSKYINGTDPAARVQSFNYMHGLNRDGTPYLYDGRFLRYMNSGDPITQQGDIDANPADRRTMASCGPIAFNPGDSQEVVLRYATIHGSNRFESLGLLKLTLNGVLKETECQSFITSVSDYGRLQDVRFAPDSERWLAGINFGVEYFNHGCSYGDAFWGSQLHSFDQPDSFPRVDIVFSDRMTQKAYRYVGPGYSFAGLVEVPFAVWDIDHMRQLNVGFCEQPDSRTFNSTWDLDDPEHFGGREYLFIFNSTYPGDEAGPLAEYTTKNIRGDAATMDILYGAWLALEPGHSMNELRHGQRLRFEAQTTNKNGARGVISFAPTDLGDQRRQTISVLCQTTGLGTVYPETSDTTVFRLAPHQEVQRTTRGADVDSAQEMRNGNGEVEPPFGRHVLGRANSTGDWKIGDHGSGILNFYGHMDTHDWEIRFTPSGSQFYIRSTRALAAVRAPFEIWDIGAGTPNDPSDDRRMSIVLNDVNGDGSWSMDDRMYAYDQLYNEPQPPTIPVNWDSACRIGRIIFESEVGRTAVPATGTIVRFTVRKLILAAPAVGPVKEHDFVGQTASLASALPDDILLDWDLVFSPKSGHSIDGTLLLKDKMSGQYRGAVVLWGQLTQTCCLGTRGNVDCDASNSIDISDLTALVDYLWISQRPLCCPVSASLDGQPNTDIVDVLALVEYMYISFGAVPPCP